MTLEKTQIISGPYQSAFVANKIITHNTFFEGKMITHDTYYCFWNS